MINMKRENLNYHYQKGKRNSSKEKIVLSQLQQAKLTFCFLITLIISLQMRRKKQNHIYLVSILRIDVLLEFFFSLRTSFRFFHFFSHSVLTSHFFFFSSMRTFQSCFSMFPHDHRMNS